MAKPDKFTVYVDPKRKKAVLRSSEHVDTPRLRRARWSRRILLVVGIPLCLYFIWDGWVQYHDLVMTLISALIFGGGLCFFAWLSTGGVQCAEAAALGDRLDEEMTVEGKLLKYSYRRVLEPLGTKHEVLIHLGASKVQRQGRNLIFTGGVTEKRLSTDQKETVDYPQQFTLTDYFLPPVAEVLEDREISIQNV